MDEEENQIHIIDIEYLEDQVEYEEPEPAVVEYREEFFVKKMYEKLVSFFSSDLSEQYSRDEEYKIGGISL